MNQQKFEIRSSEITADDQKLTGYVVKWNSPSEVLFCDFIEQFSPNAFTETLKENKDVRALFEHDFSKLLGRTSSGTLKLEQDKIGLRFELTPPDTSLGRDLLVSVARGDISGMSFGFLPLEETWDFEQEPALRQIQKAELFEITVTSIPAYPESSVELSKRSMMTAKEKTQTKSTALFNYWADLAEF
ncbi:prohead protease (GP4) [[Actinobacillus] rossii]|uniref:Prohead protease (GP4) n=1 Tax=[Actinobacillus] rossii TaxID=123820 RepID=A0A380U2C8_9PAST|nr:prohead protease (GP4) [[Actinobacillus] rossii]